MIWVNIFHAYQPPGWSTEILTKVAAESYRPFFEWLAAHPRIRLTVNVAGSLTEQLEANGAHDIVKNIAGLAARGQIELMGSAMYHPILPLMSESTARRQILQNSLRNHDLLGDAYAPRGFFPPELAFQPDLGRVISDAGFSWIALDEIAFDGNIGTAKFSTLFQMPNAPLYCIFRNRVISDYLFFSAPLDDPSAFWQSVERDGRSTEVLITAMDLENLGHHRPGLDLYWQTLLKDPRVTTMTASDLLQHLSSSRPQQMTPCAASWATRPMDIARNVPFPLWKDPDNPIHHLQWQLTDLLLEEMTSSAFANSPALLQNIDRALASDQYWWASATPWWDVSIIRRGADALFSALRELHPTPVVLRRAENLKSAIDDLTAHWHDAGVADRRRSAFLEDGAIRRLGGTVIRSERQRRPQNGGK